MLDKEITAELEAEDVISSAKPCCAARALEQRHHSFAMSASSSSRRPPTTSHRLQNDMPPGAWAASLYTAGPCVET